MATRTIANGGGNWSSTGTWAEGTVPTSADDVIATGTSGNLTIDVTAVCRSIDLTGYVGTFTNTGALSIGDATNPPGNNAVVFPISGWTYSGSGAVNLSSTSATQLNVNFGGVSVGQVRCNGTGGSWKLTGNLVTNAALSFNPSTTFDANGFNVTAATFGVGSSPVVLTMGSGTWTLTGNNATIWNFTTLTGNTITHGNPVVCNYSGSTGTRVIDHGGTAGTLAGAVAFNITAGSDTVQTKGHIYALDLTGFSGTWTISGTTNVYTNGLTAPAAVTVPTSGTLSLNWTTSSSLTSNGKTWGCGITINGSGGTVTLADDLVCTGAFSLTLGGFDANGKNVTVKTFASSTAVRSLAMGTGTWTITGNAATVVNVNATSLTVISSTPLLLNYSGSTGTRTISATSLLDVTVTAGSDIVTLIVAGSVRSLAFDGFTGTWNIPASSNVFGNLTITSNSSGMTVGASSNTLTFGATSGTKTITTAGKTLDFPATVNGVGGTVQFADNFTLGTTRTLTLTNGTLDLNGKNVSVGKFASNNSNTRTLTMGNGTLALTGTGTVWNTATVTNLTLTPGTCAVSLTGTAATIAGSPTFYSFTKTVTTADTLTFTDGITVTVTNSLTLQGASGQLLTLAGSGTSGWTLAVPATQSISHVSVSYSTATGNSALAASSDSINGGNNVNWIFISVNSISPVISGTVSVGSTLTTTNGTWTNSPTSYTYQWQRADDLAFTQNITNIGSNQNTFTLTNSENSKYIRCQVTAINLAGSSTTNNSNILGPIITSTSTSKGQAYKSPVNNYYPNPIKL
jgi:hypothetical protein